MNRRLILTRRVERSRSRNSRLRSHDARRGFTIVELLVVIGITSVLMGLVLPAVQNARAAARRTQCQNNLRQQGIAIHNHIDTWGFIPGGGWGAEWLGMSDRGSGHRQPGGWIYSILPHCEQKALFELAPAFSPGSVDPAAVQAFAAKTVPLFSCPERRDPHVGPANPKFRYFGVVQLQECARGDYAINGGSFHLLGINGPPSLDPAIIDSFDWPDTSQLNGVSFLRSEIRIADITDGTSNTIAVGEKWTNRTGDAVNGDDQPFVAGDCLDIRRWGLEAPAKDGHELGSQTTFGSAHESGASFLFADGAVKMVPYYIDPSVFETQCARNDGTALSDGAF